MNAICNNKKWVSIVGDSISTFEGYNPAGYSVFYDKFQQERLGLQSVYDCWWAKVNQYLKAYLCVNNSYSGSKVSGSVFPSGSSIERTSFLNIEGHSPDIILVYIGFNDFGNGVTVSNGIFSRDKQDFYHSYVTMLHRIKRNYPNAHIICATLMRGFIKNKPDWIFPEKYCGIPLEEYNHAIRKAVKMEKVSLVDLSSKNHFYETLDGTHPTVSGHLTIANTWIECLAELV